MKEYPRLFDAARMVHGGPDVRVVLTVPEYNALVERNSGAPRLLSTAQAASFFGYTAKAWRNRCKDGKLPRAFLDERDRWRIPREDAERFIAQQRNRNGGIRGPRKRGPSAPPQAP